MTGHSPAQCIGVGSVARSSRRSCPCSCSPRWPALWWTACPGSASWSRRICGAPCWRVLPLADHRVAAVYALVFGLSAGAVSFNPASASVLPGIVGKANWWQRTAACGRRRSCPRLCSRDHPPARSALRGLPPRRVISARRHRRIPGLREISRSSRATRSASFVTSARSSAFSAFSSAFSARSAVTTSGAPGRVRHTGTRSEPAFRKQHNTESRPAADDATLARCRADGNEPGRSATKSLIPNEMASRLSSIRVTGGSRGPARALPDSASW